MTEERTGPDDAGKLFGQWMASMQAMWQPMMTAWSEQAAGMFSPESDAPSKARGAANWDATLKIWKAMASALGDPASFDAAMKGLSAMPETAFKLLQSTGSGLAVLQQKWAERLEKMRRSDKPFSFDDLDQEFINRWTDLYRSELSQYFRIPQIGLTRFYQERMAAAVDHYNVYQAANAEFMQLLTTPVEKSFRVMQEKLAEMAEEGPLPEDAKFYYNLWIKTLEGHFMTLFQSPEYTAALAKTTEAMSRFTAAREKVMEDVLQSLPVPTNRDIDELYREIYQLKKTVKRLEKRAKGK